MLYYLMILINLQTSFYDRVFGPYWGRKLRNYPYPENFLEDMEKELDEILKKYRKYQKSY